MKECEKDLLYRECTDKCEITFIKEENHHNDDISSDLLEFGLSVSSARAMIEKLPEDMKVDGLTSLWDHGMDHINSIIRDKTNGTYESTSVILDNALGKVYDEKYGNKTNDCDVRDIDPTWVNEYWNILAHMGLYKDMFKDMDGIIVGVGNGEDISLYRDLKTISLVDISEVVLGNIYCKLGCPVNVSVYKRNAQLLSGIKSGSFDLYLSLQTYQCAFFDIERSLLEAIRVLRDNGVIIISVANGYRFLDDTYCQGLMNPETNVLDRKRPFDLAHKIVCLLIDHKFTSIGIKSTTSDIYIYGRKQLS